MCFFLFALLQDIPDSSFCLEVLRLAGILGYAQHIRYFLVTKAFDSKQVEDGAIACR